MAIKDKFVQFRASEEERALLQRYAKKARQPVSRYILNLVVRSNGQLPPSVVKSGYDVYFGGPQKSPIIKGASLTEVLRELSSRYKSGEWGAEDSCTVMQGEVIALELSYSDAESFF